MIRRDVTLPDGSRMWALISQVEHARLSGELAARWVGPAVPPILADENDPDPLQTARQQVLATITRHDDGWAAWEAAPTLDPVRGCPPSFLEMSTDESLAIWDDSISRAEEIGPLAAWMVAGHFRYLLGHGDSAEESIAQQWLAEMDKRRRYWLDAWTKIAPTWHTVERADAALGWLQLFDQFSLWLCCFLPTVDEPIDPEFSSATSKMPGGNSIRVAAVSGPTTAIAVEPWPYVADRWEASVSGHLVPVRRYSTTGELLAARRPCTLRWQLVPA